MTQLQEPPTRTPTTGARAPGDGRAAPGASADGGVDTAQQSLADALRVSFNVLKVLMILLVVGYLVFSGLFIVEEQQRLVLLRFGKIVGGTDGQVYGPGIYWSLPYPIYEKKWVKVAPQQLTVNDSFWFEITERDRGRSLDEMATGRRPLNPIRDGSLLTGDASVVHGQFKLTYAIEDPVVYVEHVGDPALAEQLVRDAVERGIIHAAARVNADDFIGSRWGANTAKNFAQHVLDQVPSGITITDLSATSTEMPLAVRTAYREVSNAQNERGQLIAGARQEYSRIMVETAGAAHDSLYQLIQEYERAIELDEQPAEDALRAELDGVFTSLLMPESRGGREVGGEVAATINRANTERSQIVQSVKADAARFEALLAEYRENPGVVVNRIWEQARRRVLASPNVETIYAPDGSENRVSVTPDPEIARERERQRMRLQDEQLREQQQERLR